MNLEGIALQLPTRELSAALSGGKIFKIFMPSRASLLLQVNQQNRTCNSAGGYERGDSPLITLPETLAGTARPRPVSACCSGSIWKKGGSPKSPSGGWTGS